jgi:DNA-binding winged helix-turn-helix (wHTH) protein
VTEQKIMEKLGAGMPTPPGDLVACLPDEMSDVTSVYTHVYNINQKIKPHREIVSVYRRGRYYYQLFRSINSDE